MVVFYVTLTAIICTLLGGLFAIKFKDKLHLILGFSAGAVLGVVLFDLIPEAVELTKTAYSIEQVMLLVAGGFGLYMLMDRNFLIHAHSHDCEGDDCENPAHKGNIGVAAVVFHSFLDGFAIGMAFKASPQIGWVIAAAILAHKFSDGINTVGLVLREKDDQKIAFNWLIISALAPALGMASTFLFTISDPVLGLVLAVFAGLFIYLSASDLIPESHHHHSTVWTSIFTIAGMAISYLAIHFAL